MEDGSMNGAVRAPRAAKGTIGGTISFEAISFEPIIEAARGALDAFSREHFLYETQYRACCRATLSVPLDGDDPQLGASGRHDMGDAMAVRARELEGAASGLLRSFDIRHELGDAGHSLVCRTRFGRAILHQRDLLSALWMDGAAADGFIPPAEVREAMIARAAILLALMNEADSEDRRSA